MTRSLARDPMFDDDAPDTTARKVNTCAEHGPYSKAVEKCPRCPKGAEPVKPVIVKRRVTKEINVLAKPERVDLPPMLHQRGGWEAAVLDALRSVPGVWHRVAECEDKGQAAHSAGTARGRHKGEFEFAARGATVYARFVGKGGKK